eukprot:1354422-Amorphochlora_amoeboformis.AAC.1
MRRALRSNSEELWEDTETPLEFLGLFLDSPSTEEVREAQMSERDWRKGPGSPSAPWKAAPLNLVFHATSPTRQRRCSSVVTWSLDELKED